MGHLWGDGSRLFPLGTILLDNLEGGLELESDLSNLRLHIAAAAVAFDDGWLHAGRKLLVLVLL
jgi:hypothetical protein